MAGVDEALDLFEKTVTNVLIKYEPQIGIYIIKPLIFELLFHTEPTQKKSVIVGLLFLNKFLHLYHQGDRGNFFYVLGFAALCVNLIAFSMNNIMAYAYLYSEDVTSSLIISTSAFLLNPYLTMPYTVAAIGLVTALQDIILLSIYNNQHDIAKYDKMCEKIYAHTFTNQLINTSANITYYIRSIIAWHIGIRSAHRI